MTEKYRGYVLTRHNENWFACKDGETCFDGASKYDVKDAIDAFLDEDHAE